ncbi:hypothetical protein BHM03_00033327 [Ensete ventricosum]|nr:hypothetical protein BHM03_00033327 [Ensete ventricosum]
MSVLKPIEPLNSISFEVDDDNLHSGGIGGSVEAKIVLRAQDPSDRVSFFPYKEVYPHASHPRPGRSQGQPEREASGARKGRQPPVGAEASPAGTAGCGQPAGTTTCSMAPAKGAVVGHPQGATAHGQPYRQQGRRRQPQGWLPLGRATASEQG